MACAFLSLGLVGQDSRHMLPSSTGMRADTSAHGQVFVQHRLTCGEPNELDATLYSWWCSSLALAAAAEELVLEC